MFRSVFIHLGMITMMINQATAAIDPSSSSSSVELKVLFERLDKLEVLIGDIELMEDEQELKVHNLMVSLDEQVDNVTTATIKTSEKRKLGGACDFYYADGYCRLRYDTYVDGDVYVMDGLFVEEDAYFYHDVIFDDDVSFHGYVTFDDDVEFENDVEVIGGSDSDDTTDFYFSGLVTPIFKQESRLEVETDAKFYKDVFLQRESTSDDAPDLYLDGDFELKGKYLRVH